MFYAQSLLARKAPLGEIWMAATLHAKLNRKKLNRINLIRICEEILNPAAPLALRITSILMGGVVIVFERKVKLLHDDANRLLDELNHAWKVKSNSDPTVLPKRRAQAKKEAITLPEHGDTDVGGDINIEHDASSLYSEMFRQQQTEGYFLMQLDSVDLGEAFNDNVGEGDQHQNFHQADPEDITLPQRYDPADAYADLFNNRYDRFEIEGDDLDITSIEHTQIQISSPKLVPSPPHQNQHQEHQQPDQVLDDLEQMQDIQVNGQQRQGQGPIRRRKRKTPTSVMDNDQTIHPGHVYQSWLRDTSDITRGRRNKMPKNKMSAIKIAKLMQQPASILMGSLFKPGSGEIYYPPPLLELWKDTSTHGLPSANTSPPLPRESSSRSPAGRNAYQDPVMQPVEELHSGGGSQSFPSPTEQIRTNLVNNEVPPEIMDDLRANLTGIRGIDTHLATPCNSGDERRSIPSSSSGKGINKNSSEVNSGRKRRYSSRLSIDGLEPVSEDNGHHHPEANFNVPGNDPTPEQELLIMNAKQEEVTQSIRMTLKDHFETESEFASLNNLAAGRVRKEAARLFYQTCVLATRGFIKVKQVAPYEDIILTRGPNM